MKPINFVMTLEEANIERPICPLCKTKMFIQHDRYDNHSNIHWQCACGGNLGYTELEKYADNMDYM